MKHHNRFISAATHNKNAWMQTMSEQFRQWAADFIREDREMVARKLYAAGEYSAAKMVRDTITA
jgi:hypothetical protein